MVKPSWSRQKPKNGQAIVILDPGLSFGTGQHATTSFCLKQIAKHKPKGNAKSLLDIGSGSGILAIAAAKLGYLPVKAFDFDPVAVRVANKNSRINRVHNRVLIKRQDLTKLPVDTRERFNLLCANLTLNLLLSERRKILNRLAPKGTLILAGILASEFSEVQNAYQAEGLKLCETKIEREWQSGSFT